MKLFYLTLFLTCATPAFAGSGPEQRQIEVTVVVPPPEPNYWPAVIGGLGTVAAALIGVAVHRRRR